MTTTRSRYIEQLKMQLPTNPYDAYQYALHVIKGRWPEGEPIIATDPHVSFLYSAYVINGLCRGTKCGDITYKEKIRWPEGEAAIMEDPEWAYQYAYCILGRWPEAEATIANSEWKHKYLKAFPRVADDWILKGWLDWLDT